MKTVILIFTLSLLGSLSVSAQSMGRTYTTALGVKVWDGAGISLKSFINDDDAIEAIAYWGSNGTRVTGLYEIHGNLGDAPGLKWYVGPGAHMGFYKRNKVVIGVDGVIGLDLKVNRAPINFSLDWQPAFEFGDARGWNGNWGGVGIRYTF